MRLVKTLECLAAGAALCSTLVAADAAAVGVPVTSCGQVVTKAGMLVGDLDCSGSAEAAVVLERGARLDLAGFTLTADETGVLCGPGCKVFGPGVIRRPALEPVSDNYGIFATSRARVRDGVVLENWRVGVYALGPLRLGGATVNGCTVGALGAPIRVDGSTFTGNEIGVLGASGTKNGEDYIFFACRVARSSFSANDIDIASYRRPAVRDTDCTTSDRRTIPATPFLGGDEWEVCG